MKNHFADSTDDTLYIRDEENDKATFYKKNSDTIIIKSVEGCDLNRNGAEELISFLQDHFNLTRH